MMFLLSQREKNTEILCKNCQHLVFGECNRLVQCEDISGNVFYVRLARFSESGGYCQLFMRRPCTYDLNCEGNETEEMCSDEKN